MQTLCLHKARRVCMVLTHNDSVGLEECQFGIARHNLPQWRGRSISGDFRRRRAAWQWPNHPGGGGERLHRGRTAPTRTKPARRLDRGLEDGLVSAENDSTYRLVRKVGGAVWPRDGRRREAWVGWGRLVGVVGTYLRRGPVLCGRRSLVSPL